MDEAYKTPAESDILNPFNSGLIAAAGFACMSAWGIYVVLSPSMPILSFAPTDQAISCLIISRVASVIALALCMARPSIVQNHLKELIFPCMTCAYLPVAICGALGNSHIDIPFAALGAAWALCGVADLVLPIAWMSILSFMPTRQIVLSIAVGGILTTPLFLLVASASFPLVSIFSAAGMLSASGVGAYCLISRQNASTSEQTTPESAPLSASAMLSLAAHSLVYGYMAIMLCSLNFVFVLAAGSAGLLSSLVAAWWLRNFNKHNWDTAKSQRLTIPFVTISILIVPLSGEIGQMIGAALAIGAFSYVTLMEWTGTAMANAEFRLAFGIRQIQGTLMRWGGFAIGATIAFFSFYVHPVSQIGLTAISSVLVVVVVTAFVVYEGTERKEINELLSLMVSESSELVIDPPKNAAPFRDRCNAIIEKGNLTPREGEVFLCLAKGRNTEYIQRKLFISASTTRTHILHIYRKLGINSQQQLIDLVDQRN